MLARFEQERQALALMDHPNIAQVYDAGLTSSGQPCLVAASTALFGLILAANQVADAVRDVLDPRTAAEARWARNRIAVMGSSAPTRV